MRSVVCSWHPDTFLDEYRSGRLLNLVSENMNVLGFMRRTFLPGYEDTVTHDILLKQYCLIVAPNYWQDRTP